MPILKNKPIDPVKPPVVAETGNCLTCTLLRDHTCPFRSEVVKAMMTDTTAFRARAPGDCECGGEQFTPAGSKGMQKAMARAAAAGVSLHTRAFGAERAVAVEIKEIK
jgi:hypothetical protein